MVERGVGRQRGDDPADRDRDADRARARRGAAAGRRPAARGAAGRAGAPRSRSATACAGVGGPSRPGRGRCWCGRRGRRERRSRATATPSATAVTTPTVDMVSDGAPALPRRPAPGSVSSGAASHPTASPAAAASRATTTYSASSTAATRPGVPPTALSSPTRRVWSAIRPPTRTATLATASRPSSRLPISRTRRWSCDQLVVLVADLLPRLQDWCGPGSSGDAVVDERRRVGRVGQLQVHDVGEGFLRRGETADIRLGEPDQAGLDRVDGASASAATAGSSAAAVQRLALHGLGDLGADPPKHTSG